MPVKDSYSKLQRWTDLIATLLTRQYPASFEELALEIPAYAQGRDPAHKDSVKRTFERDKDELRDFGVPIESVAIDEGESTGYRLKPARFYLPYLTVADAEHGASRTRPEGYRALPELRLEPDELSAIAEAIGRLQQLGDPTLTEDTHSAARKLAFDIPLYGMPSDVALLGTDDGSDPATYELLADALRNRKSVSFRYYAPSSEQTTERHVNPYGLFFVSAHWYLAGFDRTRDGVRNFRLSRMSAVTMNRKKSQSPDYQIPETFRLREHAQSKTAWELGDVEPQIAEVRFTGGAGAALAAARSGDEVGGDPMLRRFTVRRLDVFARWLLSLGGDATPVSPPSLVSSYRELVRATLHRYTSGKPA